MVSVSLGLGRHYIEHTAGNRPTCTQCGDLAGNPPKRDGEVTRPVHDSGQGDCL